MATTPEGKVKARLKKLLMQYGVYYHMPVMNGMGAPTLDFVCCHRGRFFGVETKAGDKQPTERQQHTMENIRRAGGLAFLINETEETWITLEAWLKLGGGNAR